MNLLQIAITFFVFIEILNIMTLYFSPGASYGNGVGVFKAYHECQKDEKVFSLVSYLVNWIAGAKLIFIMIGLVVVIFGNEMTQIGTVVALIISISSFYFRLYPAIKKLDEDGEVTTKGFSKTLNYMIVIFLVMFTTSLIIYLH